MACKIIRNHTRKGDTLLDTFKVICANRESHPVDVWAVYDLKKLKNKRGEKTKIPEGDSVRRQYDKHLARLEELFRVRP